MDGYDGDGMDYEGEESDFEMDEDMSEDFSDDGVMSEIEAEETESDWDDYIDEMAGEELGLNDEVEGDWEDWLAEAEDEMLDDWHKETCAEEEQNYPGMQESITDDEIDEEDIELYKEGKGV